MDPRDPTADIEPDFEEEAWEAPRQALIEGGKSLEEAVDVLKQSWRSQHNRNLEAWNEHLLRQRTPEREGNNQHSMSKSSTD